MALAQANHTTAITPAGIPGTDHLDAEHLSMPRVKMVQPTSQVDGDARPGEFYNTLLGTSSDELRVIPLRVQFGRVLFDGDKAQGDVLCASDDSIRARPINVQFPNMVCEQCPLSEWSEDRGRRIPPACSFQYNYILLDVETGMPMKFTLMKTGIPAGRQLNTMIKAFGTTREVIIRTLEKRTDQGRYWIPVISLGPKVDADAADAYSHMAQSMATVSMAPEAEVIDEPAPVKPAEAAPPPAPAEPKIDRRLLLRTVQRLASDCVATGASDTLTDVAYDRMADGQLIAMQVELEKLLKQLQKEAIDGDMAW